jgi:hypothetical protein
MLLDLFTAFAPVIWVSNLPTVHSDAAVIVMHFDSELWNHGGVLKFR